MTGEMVTAQTSCLTLTLAARFPNLRALAWSGDQLYASRGYQLLRTTVREPFARISWQPVGAFQPAWRRKLSGSNRLTARIFRDGFHALAVLPSGGFVAAVPGAILTLLPEETMFRQTHAVLRGTRPLHITAVPGGGIFWGEYFDNAPRSEVHIYGSTDGGRTWEIAYTFPPGAIRHVHNIVYDAWEKCLWVLTGDNGGECRILRASCDFSNVESILQGNQQARAVALVPTQDALYFSSDTPVESNHIYRLDRRGNLSRLAPISSSSISGCRVGENVFFSTMVEPSRVNRDTHVRVYGSDVGEGSEWTPLLEWKKDVWPMALFQYGNAFLPDGDNTTRCLAVSTVAVQLEDMSTSLYRVNSTK
jgi:hypothetical protein